MPELPEIEGLVAWVRLNLMGRPVRDVRLRSVAALKTYDPPLNALVGQAISGANRRGKYLVIDIGDLKLVSHLSLGGWVRWVKVSAKRNPTLRGPIILEVVFDDGLLDYTEHGKEKRLAIWVVRNLEEVPRIQQLGPEAFSASLTEQQFGEILSAQRGTIKSVMANQHVLAGIGNAYSDEILHVAGMSPFLLVSKLDEGTLHTLFEATRSVLGDSVSRLTQTDIVNLKVGKQSQYRVHGRDGEACPVCADAIKSVWPGARSFQYCPTCQTGGRVYKDRRFSRLLK